MGKYTYLFFIKWKQDEFGKLGGRDYYVQEWKPKLLELCKKYGLKLLVTTTPFGTAEQDLRIFDTDIELDKYEEFVTEVSRITNYVAIDYTKTIACVDY
jgi:hypothetical protein